MKLQFLTSIVFVSLLSAFAHKTYVFDTLSEKEANALVNVKASDEIKNKLFCHVKKFLPEYTSYIKEDVLPRLNTELALLTKINIDRDGRVLKVADRLSGGDLYHVHLRAPILSVDGERKKLSPIFTNPDRYHLQYHSFETFGLYVQAWTSELREISDQALQAWLSKIEEYKGSVQGQEDPGISGDYERVVKVDLPALSEERVHYFAGLWFKFNNKRERNLLDPVDTWIYNNLVSKVKTIDPVRLASETRDVIRDRSVISQGKVFKILPNRRTNIDGYIQAANIYFAPRLSIPGLYRIVKKAEALGFDKLVNSRSKHVRSYFSLMDDDALRYQAILDDLAEVVALNTDEQNILSKILEPSREGSHHSVFLWDDEFIYSIRYSIHCDD